MKKNEVLIEGFAFGNYRSLNHIQYIGPCKKINIIIGQNNSGKSNILRYIVEQYKSSIEAIQSEQPISRSDSEVHRGQRGQKNTDIYFSIGIIKFGNIYKNLNPTATKIEHPDTIIRDDPFEGVFRHQVFRQADEQDIFWLNFLGNGLLPPKYIEELADSEYLNRSQWYSLWTKIQSKTGGDLTLHWLPDILRIIKKTVKVPSIALIPCIRRVHKEGTNQDHDQVLNGNFIIDKLAELQNPEFNEDRKRERFQNINSFLQELTCDQDANIEIPHHRGTINVYMNNRRLPLENLGTGIQEVIIIAAAATALENQVVCIEEPELHLHPDLQRRLMSYLVNKTSNQYFITTHSAHILNTQDAEIFHVKLINGESSVIRVTDDLKKFEICADLGYRASDLIQTNSIIWVEGPSDRIYLNYWIQAKAPELKENIHYSIMFYGGRLLSHLSACEHNFQEFISLHKLNQNMAIVIDSDRKNTSLDINSTKLRIQSEFEQRGNFAWITDGKEIENYINPEILKASINKVHRNIEFGQFDKYTPIKLTRDKKPVDPDKIEIAKAVCNIKPDFSIYDLDERIELLVKFIRKSNDFIE